jgi:hypothetical protein
MSIIPAAELEQAATALFKDLDRIQEASDGDWPPALAERARLMGMLAHLGEFVKCAWNAPNAIHASSRLSNLAWMLDQLKDGVVHPVVEPQKRSGKFDRADVWRARAYVIAAAECYIRSGHTRESAAAAIAKPYLKPLMRQRVGRKKKTGTLPDAIISWHRQFQQRTANSLVQLTVETLLLPLSEKHHSPEQMISAGKYYLSVAKALAQSIILPRSKA